MPFITEEIWQRLPRPDDAPESIMVAPWPSGRRDDVDEAAEREMEQLQGIVVEIRRFRADHRIPPRQRIDVVVAEGPHSDLLERHAEELKALASISDIRVGAQPAGWSRAVAGTTEIYLPLGELVDVGAERARLEREIDEEEKLADRARTKLDNPNFASGAPADVVDKVRQQLEEHSERATMMRAQLEDFG
jgi:valyl-tRNA synthetase